jgi:hypothetical protein
MAILKLALIVLNVKVHALHVRLASSAHALHVMVQMAHSSCLEESVYPPVRMGRFRFFRTLLNPTAKVACRVATFVIKQIMPFVSDARKACHSLTQHAIQYAPITM